VQELGHLALAVVQAAAYIFRSGCGLGPYLELYRTRRGKLLEEYRHHKQKMDDYEYTVYTTWQISFERLKTHAAQAAAFLQHCAYLHYNGISQEIFKHAAVNIGLLCDQEPNSFWQRQKPAGVVLDIRCLGHSEVHEYSERHSIILAD